MPGPARVRRAFSGRDGSCRRRTGFLPGPWRLAQRLGIAICPKTSPLKMVQREEQCEKRIRQILEARKGGACLGTERLEKEILRAKRSAARPIRQALPSEIATAHGCPAHLAWGD